jgi:hypothetical protein
VALRTTGLFLRYESFRPVGSGARTFSISLYDGLDRGGRPAYFLSLGVTAALGCALLVRPTRVRAAVVGGFCIGSVVAVAFMVSTATGRHPSVDFGSGFFLILAGFALEAAAATSMLFVVASASDPANPTNSRTTRFAVFAAVVVGISGSMQAVAFRGIGLFRFAPLSFRSGATAAVAFAALAIVPVLAARVQGRAGSALLIGLCASIAISVIDALSQRYGSFGGYLHITLGFWVDVVSVVLLLVLAARFAGRRVTQPDGTGDENAARAF